jgi:hypothetical protein
VGPKYSIRGSEPIKWDPQAQERPAGEAFAERPSPTQLFATPPRALTTGLLKTLGELPCQLRGYRRRGCTALCCSCWRFSRASFLRFLSFRQRRFDTEPRPIGQTVAARPPGALDLARQA